MAKCTFSELFWSSHGSRWVISKKWAMGATRNWRGPWKNTETHVWLEIHNCGEIMDRPDLIGVFRMSLILFWRRHNILYINFPNKFLGKNVLDHPCAFVFVCWSDTREKESQSLWKAHTLGLPSILCKIQGLFLSYVKNVKAAPWRLLLKELLLRSKRAPCILPWKQESVCRHFSKKTWTITCDARELRHERD